jgi:hypothetical protein
MFEHFGHFIKAILATLTEITSVAKCCYNKGVGANVTHDYYFRRFSPKFSPNNWRFFFQNFCIFRNKRHFLGGNI